MGTLSDFAAVGCGGAVGAMARFAIQNIGLFSSSRYWTTALVNISGCLLIGLGWALVNNLNCPRQLSLLAITGILGGYTTYSTFAFETFDLFRGGSPVGALIYVLITVAGGFLACGAGYIITEKLVR